MKHLLDTKVGPYQAMIPMVDVDTIGAGGGSIAYVDAGRHLPRRAALGRRRPRPGRLRPRRHRADRDRRDGQPRLAAAGDVPRRRDGPRRGRPRAAAFEEGPARALGMSVEEASMGAVQILTHSMVQSIEENSVRKGYDPRDFALVAEGGAGPLFAAQIALEVGTPSVVVPHYPGITAALGLLATDMVYEYVSTVYERLSQLDARPLQAAFEELEEQAARQLEEDGIAAERIVRPARRRLPLPRPGLRAARRRRLRRDRRRVGREGPRRLPRHPRARVLAPLRGVGHRDPERPRARDRPDAARSTVPEVEHGDESPDEALRYERDAWFRVGGELEQVPTRFYDRDGAEGRQPARGAGDRQPVRLDDRDPAGARPRTSTASGTS